MSDAAIVAQAERLADARRTGEAEALLRDLIARTPTCGPAYGALAILLADSGRDLDAFEVCAAMLGNAPGPRTYLVAAELLLFLHLRHASLTTRQQEPVRLDFRSVGVPDVAPMMLAPTFLSRALKLARTAAAHAPNDALAQVTLAECELRMGFPRAARKAAERAATIAPNIAGLTSRMFAAFADHREREALTLARQPALAAQVPLLADGRQLSLRTDGALDPATPQRDAARAPWRIPYVVQHAGKEFAREVTVHTGRPERRTIPGGRIVGGLFFPIDRDGRAYVHGIVDEPDVAFATPRFYDTGSHLAQRRNTVLCSGFDARILLHTPRAERTSEGRAFLLASNFSNNYYHWMADALGRLSAVPEILEDPDVRFVVGAPLHPFQVETLEWLGISLDRVVQVGDDEIVQFDEVIAVHHRKDGGCTDAGVWRWLRDRLGKAPQALSPQPSPPSRRLFLRRSGSVMRRLLNEARAEAICADHGFESVDTSAMTVSAQRDLFASASMVVSAVGASLTNLVFTPPGARLILFGQRGYVVPCYTALAEALGHTSRYVLGAEQQSHFPYPHWDYRIDEADLHQALAAECA